MRIVTLSIRSHVLKPLANRLNHSMSLHEFKEIFYMEWGHRVLGRIIGIGFVVPLAYFAFRKRLTATLPKNLFGMALLIGAQGALGWYMVKSGLEDSLMEVPGAVPRVSQYRLAAHLGTAFVLYAGMFGTGLSALMDWRYAKKGTWSGLADGSKWKEVLANPNVKRFARNSKLLTGLVFVTALSGMLLCELKSQVWQFPSDVLHRCVCGWPRCGVTVQRVPPHGWPSRAPV